MKKVPKSKVYLIVKKEPENKEQKQNFKKNGK